MRKIFLWVYTILMFLIPIALWVFGIIIDRLNTVNVFILCVCTALGWMGSFLMIQMIREERKYDIHIMHKANEVNLTKKLFKERFNAN